MKINTLKIISYGKFHNKTIELSGGLNVITGGNEAGKSTVLSFIRNMLYGFKSARVADIGGNDRKKYMPWGSEKIIGELIFTNEKGRTVRISRTAGKTAATDEFSAIDELTGDKYDYSPEEETGVTDAAFLNTLCIKQLKSAISGDESEITKRLANISLGAAENISCAEALKSLETEMKRYKPLRGGGGILAGLRERISALSSELAATERKREEAFELLKKIRMLRKNAEDIRKKLSELETLRAAASTAEEFKRLAECEKRCAAIRAEIAEYEKKSEKYTREISVMSAYAAEPSPEMFKSSADTETLHKMQKRSARKLICGSVICFGALTAALLTAIVFFKTPLAAVSVPAVLIADICVLMRLIRNKKRVSNELAEAKKQNAVVKSELNRYGVADIREYTEKRAKYAELSEKLHNALSAIKTLRERLAPLEEEIASSRIKTAGKKLTESDFETDDIEEEERSLRELLEETMREKYASEAYLSAEERNTRSSDLILAERSAAMAEFDRACEKYEALKLAKECVEETYSHIRSDFTPRINVRASEIFERITCGKYDKISVNQKLIPAVFSDGMKNIGYFSGGTVDQAYFAVRLALCDMLFSGRKPVFTDDAFLQYDAKRRDAALRELAERAERKEQIVIFAAEIPENLPNDAKIICL